MPSNITVPDGWGVKNYGVKLKPGKPKDATSWVDVQGRPVVKTGRTWRLQKQKPSPPRKLTPEEIQQKNSGRGAQAPQPKTDSVKKEGGGLSPEEQEAYAQLSSISKEKLAEATRKSFYPDPQQAKQDEDNRKRRFAPYLALSENQLSAIGAYTSEWDLNMNSFLRQGEIKYSPAQRMGTKPKPSAAQVEKAVEDLTSALEQLPKAPKAVYTRAVSGSVFKENGWEREATDFIKQLQGLEEGDVIEDPGFSSFTSGGAPVVDRFMQGDENSDQNIVFEVESDQMRNISPISRYENEKEHMLPPGAKFRVIGKRDGHSRRVGKHTVIQLQQITD